MNRNSILSFVIVVASICALLATTAQSQLGTPKNNVVLQPTTPGISQSGHVNVSGKLRAGSLEVQGQTIRTISRAQGYGDGDNTDNGPLVARQLSFTKQYEDTGLRVVYTDTFRVYGTYSAGRWEVRFNGNSSTPPLAWDIFLSNVDDRLQPSTLTGTVFGLPAGTHTVQVYVGDSPGLGLSDRYTGWQGRWSLEVEEVR